LLGFQLKKDSPSFWGGLFKLRVEDGTTCLPAGRLWNHFEGFGLAFLPLVDAHLFTKNTEVID